MTRPATLWLAGGAVSVAAHAVFLGVLALAIAPDPTPRQPMPETRLDIAAYEVPSSVASRQTPDSDAARQSAATGAALSDTVVAQSRARPVSPASQEVSVSTAPTGDVTPSVRPRPDRATIPNAASAPAAPISADPTVVGPSQPPATALASPQVLAVALTAASQAPVQAAVARAPTAQSLNLAPPAPVRLAARPAPSVAGAAAADHGTPLVSVEPAPVAARNSPADMTALAQSDPDPVPGQQFAALGPRADSRPAVDFAAMALAVPPPSEKSTAALAWTGSDQGSVDPESLAAIQAFMEPGDLARIQGNAGRLRDGIQEVLASVPCARLQTTFIPETGQLALRGHVPEEALKAPVVHALQARIGGDIRIDDQLLILPRPQCGALSGIAAVGLPQSTEQLTNPRIIGQNAHVREYAYSEGQLLEFDLTAPDYDAYIYVDYFDADGMVIHLQPNDIVPAALYGAKAPLSVGRDTGRTPALQITIAPPFGQEIAVAFAASQPLYNDARPLMEPADAYLDFLADRVAEARVRDPGFKGEWVYFFISTHPGPAQTD